MTGATAADRKRDYFLASAAVAVATSLIWLALLQVVSMSPQEARDSRRAPDLPSPTAILESREAATGGSGIFAPLGAITEDPHGLPAVVIEGTAQSRVVRVELGKPSRGFVPVASNDLKAGDSVRLFGPVDIPGVPPNVPAP